MYVKNLKISIILILFIVVMNIAIPVQALSIDEIWSTGTKFLEDGDKVPLDENGNPKVAFDGEKMQSSMKSLFNIFFTGGMVIAVIIGAILGIKFMTEGVEGKAKIKEALIPFCVGCAIIFGGATIWRISMELFGEVENTTSTITEGVENCRTTGKHDYQKFTTRQHKCSYCGKTEEHNFKRIDGDGEEVISFVCSADGCKQTCIHEMEFSDGKLQCNNKGADGMTCNFKTISCDVKGPGGGTGRHHNDKDNDGHCDYCYVEV